MPNWSDRLNNIPWGKIYTFVVGPAVLTMPAGRIVYIWVKDIKSCLIIGYLIGWVLVVAIYYYVHRYSKKE